MFEKTINCQILNIFEARNLEKIAAQLKEDLSDEIQTYIKNLKSDPNNVYVLMTPLGASEMYGKNNNGDSFFEKALNPSEEDLKGLPKDKIYGHKSFELQPAKIYYKHFNKIPEMSAGEVVKSAYNQNMKRVEVVAKIDKNKTPELADKIERLEEKRAHGEKINNDEDVKISMGCRLNTGDVCSICGNRARTKLEYCEHLRDHMGETLPDGRQVYAINEQPLFFDISIVDSPAAGEAAVLRKVASSIDEAKEIVTLPEIRTYFSEEDSSIKKVKDLMRGLSNSEKQIPTETLEKLASEYEFEDILDSLGMSGVILKPSEFQYLALRGAGRKDLAEQYDSMNLVFPDSSIAKEIPGGQINKNIMKVASQFIPERSMFDPYISLRLLEKRASGKNKKIFENPLLLKVANLYNGYRENLVKLINREKITKTIRENPEIINWYMQSESPEFKLASMSIETEEELVDNIFNTISKLYLVLG